MNPVNFDFLDSVELSEVSGKKSSTSAGKFPQNPEGGNKLRIFPDGKVFPSKELVEAFELAFTPVTAAHPGNGFDVFISEDWGQWPVDQPKNILFISSVSRNEPKVDLFASSKHDENGNPKSDVLTQGSPSFGKSTFIALLERALGEEDIFKNRFYIDLEVVTDKPLKFASNKIYHLPTIVARGKNKGDVTYKRRENSVIYPLAILVDPSEDVPSESTEPATGTAQTTPANTPGTVDSQHGEGYDSDSPKTEEDALAAGVFEN